MRKSNYIYEIRNSKTERSYIGASKYPFTRWAEHFSQLNRNVHCNKKLQEEWHQYLISSWEFRIIEKVFDQNSSADREAYWIQKLNAAYIGYNVAKIIKQNQYNRIENLIGKMTYREIAKLEKVSLGLVAKIKKHMDMREPVLI